MTAPIGVPASGPAATSQIVTERLLLRRFERHDLAEFVRYRSDPDVAGYQGWSSPFSDADAERFLDSQRGLAFGRPGPWIQLAAIDRRSAVMHGDCGVCVCGEQPATAEIGVTLAERSQGNDLATEIVTAVVRSLFTNHGVGRVQAKVDTRNLAAQRLLERAGFRSDQSLDETEWFKGEWLTARVYWFPHTPTESRSAQAASRSARGLRPPSRVSRM